MNLEEFIKATLQEDIGEGDHTTLATIGENAMGKAEIIIKEACIISGIVLADQIFTYYDSTLNVKTHFNDGDRVGAGITCITIEGRLRSMLSCERLVLNCMQRMSGIASLTYKMCAQIAGTKAKILDTRKTTPLFRLIEKWAVKTGGGENHRFGLFDMILIKNNHVDAAGGVAKAIQLAKEYLEKKNKNLFITVEARDMNEVNEAMQTGGVNRILLDNFSPAQLVEAVKMIGGKIETEASGKITLDNVRQYAETGVDFISAGALTHSYKTIDMSLRITGKQE
jgi:nicotinate-nucleotide pyrophosphorylase (carboxylating)